MKYLFLLLLTCLTFQNCTSKKANDKNASDSQSTSSSVVPPLDNPQAISFLGKELNSPSPSKNLIDRYVQKKKLYDQNPKDLDHIIWFGRFTAYIGNYKKAIDIYTEGLSLYPDEPRLYRHRGHRYITIRKIDLAIADLSKAEELITDTENKVEQDGMPNDQNIPVSTLHGNIYYHLGLAHYINNDMPNALAAYHSCLNTSSNPDNLVSSTHWLYMIMRRLNMLEEAERILDPIKTNLNVIENHSYYNLCQFYKGVRNEQFILNSEGAASANDAVKYGVANWYMYNGNKAEAKKQLDHIIGQPSWASFGYIAAEADLSKIDD